MSVAAWCNNMWQKTPQPHIVVSLAPSLGNAAVELKGELA